MSSRTEFELVWQARVKTAWRQYEEASQEFSMMTGEFQKGFYQTPDGGAALHVARQRETLALNEYMRTLQIYTDLVLKCVLSEEGSGSV